MKKILNSYKNLFVLVLFLLISFGVNVASAEAACSLGNSSVSPSTAKAGDVVTISWNVVGSCNRTEIYLNGWPDSTLLKNQSTTLPGEYSYKRTLPPTFAGENYDLTLFGDCSGYNGFSTSCGSASLSVDVVSIPSEKLPDLMAGEPSYHKGPNSGDSKTVTFFSSTISNVGEGDVGTRENVYGGTYGGFYNNFQIAAGSNGSGNITTLGYGNSSQSQMYMFWDNPSGWPSGSSGGVPTFNGDYDPNDIFSFYPYDKAGGTYSVRACADSSDLYPESGGENNCSGWVNFIITAPDLYIGNIWGGNLVVGQTAGLGVNIGNYGDASTNGSFVATIKLARQSNGSGLIETFSNTYTTMNGGTDPSVHNTFYGSYTFTTAGIYYIQGCVDTGSVIAESNETNNCSAWTAITVGDAQVGDACGSGSGTVPQNPEPTGTSACSSGTLNSNSPADITTSGSQAWRWSCGTVTSCSAPKFGCRITTDSNYTLPQYGASGPNNNYGCANTCANGYTNPPTCTPPPPSSDACGTASGATPKVSQPINPEACTQGTLNQNSPADTNLAWNWSCGTATSCSAPKYGCTTATDTNYNPTGPNNTYGCANTCANGYRNYPICIDENSATINVVSNVPTHWCINGTICDTGTTKTYTVPLVTGAPFYIEGDPVNNYTGPTITNTVTGSEGNNSFLLYPGENETFYLSYTLIGDPPCTTCTGGGFDYSLSGPDSVDVVQGGSGEITITAKLINTPRSPVTLIPSGNPLGVSVQPSACYPLIGPTCTSNIQIIVGSSVPVGTHQIKITGTPLNRTKTFTLRVTDDGGGGGGGSLQVSCASAPLGQAWVGEPVTWTANVSGGNPPYRYIWSGDSIPSNPPPTFNQNGTINQYNIAYTTTGTKSAQVEVTDGSQTALRKTCDKSAIQIKVNPTFEER